MTIGNEKFTARKDRKKWIRVVIQIVILLAIAAICITALFTLKRYTPYTPQNTRFSGDKGFIALAYFGVDRTGNQTLIGEARLREQLQALKNLGYVTITQQDILNYYQSGKELPEKSLFLIFEDGRRDSAIFAQKILEDLNYKATMLTYPEKFAEKDMKFLKPDELKELQKTTFWEMGTNGYRLAFINVFDRYDNYLGELSPLEFSSVAPYLGRKYNHYLMDYIRDKYGIPKESTDQMKKRISYDYEAMRDIYTKSIGYVPQMYILMHSNTGSFGNNDKVSAVNEYWIKTLFKMNFNREGFCFNRRNSSIYDLTRMQPQAYWSTNHLLMRIKYDINQNLDFVKGDLNRQRDWETRKGALEIQDDTMILTSLPKDRGLVRLKNSNDFKDLKLSVRLRGNKLGLQKIYLRADETLNRFLSVAIFNNILYVAEKAGGVEKELFKLNLDRLDGKEPVSVPEDKKAAEARELETFARYANSAEKAKIYAKRLEAKKMEPVSSVVGGAKEYVPDLSVHAKGDRMLSLSLKGDRISIRIDGKDAVKDLQVANGQPGSVYLESAWGGYGWSQRNLADDVYDGVFQKLIITENTGAEQEKILFDSRLQGLDAVKFKMKQLWDALINWSVANL
ncbi:glycoside hydrolase/deacetylase beta/alpha-barrel [Lucifera butyrica]|uniref:Glycoside hydrolase/deacetylase beta/alpha-barrel n=1 Tax=Lucifera butyrica TaxID=1351585 RepID=A0A498REP8_9FIRM|nr:glycoside hydrolase [Lucifera butyrica]VBB09485.1 glycoside hydrolase/deacetylase beta/alpha-barrel [Lucifera butyrica]